MLWYAVWRYCQQWAWDYSGVRDKPHQVESHHRNGTTANGQHAAAEQQQRLKGPSTPVSFPAAAESPAGVPPQIAARQGTAIVTGEAWLGSWLPAALLTDTATGSVRVCPGRAQALHLQNMHTMHVRQFLPSRCMMLCQATCVRDSTANPPSLSNVVLSSPSTAASLILVANLPACASQPSPTISAPHPHPRLNPTLTLTPRRQDDKGPPCVPHPACCWLARGAGGDSQVLACRGTLQQQRGCLHDCASA
jgi:hypothetical protein